MPPPIVVKLAPVFESTIIILILGKICSRISKYILALELTYVSDKILAGDDEYLAYMPEMMDQNLKTDKKELMKKDKTFWKTWLRDNKEDVEILRNIN